ncbi:isoquinoline 1-oxidoreductase beta subunit [Hydrogenophaga palleronii]|uniref:Isoquinoline 1-oxidoreductase beta subunit n=1 Tax=Hydrogenophaga palleronii TaxID=65655 RepID=A0ABU1WPX2_9BURK|nr:xanthine dehydrogenase family protein [Hydrogenophaga palleronii]MDR7151343.1 isoquinoline 1-oxidoreductase beta subunit [Hydrogenophaga palleronii]
MNTIALSRRRFLQLGAGGLTVAVVPSLTGCALPVIPKRPQPSLQDALGWVRHVDGRTTLIIPRVEMGQNILTALKQIVCLEMGVAWDTVDAQLHSTTTIGRVRATVGSDSVKDFALPLAQACATLRDALASGQTQGQLTVVERPLDQLRFLQARSPLPTGPHLPMEQGTAIVRGEPLYVADVRRPGMLFGRVLRAPVSPELRSRPGPMNDAAGRAIPGFVALVRDPLLTMSNSEGVGIVARTPGALDRVEQALAMAWQIDGGFGQSTIDAAIDIDRRLADSPRRAHQVHDEKIQEVGEWDVDLRIDVPLAAHAAIEPRAAVAEFDAQGHLQLWVGSQDVFYQRDAVAKRLGLSEDQVQVHGQRVGGAFGGKTICTVELEAAVLARAAKAPVKVQWNRAQEFKHGFHRPPSSHRIRARLQDGRLQHWWHSFASSHILLTSAAAPPWLQLVTHVIGDMGVARGATLPYRAKARRSEFDLERLPVHTGPWRGLGAGPNVLALESAMDECARAAGADPVQFRLDHIDDPRLADVLRMAVKAAESKEAPAAMPHAKRGRGVSCGIYKEKSYAAVVADVQVDPTTGEIRVLQMWCAHDCGHVINADQVRVQCEGNLVWGLGMALIEQLPVGTSEVAAMNFADSPIPRLGEVPPMQVLLVDSTEPPTGAGETAIVASAAAIANAIRDAVGVRPTRLPVRAEDLRTMLGTPSSTTVPSRP